MKSFISVVLSIIFLSISINASEQEVTSEIKKKLRDRLQNSNAIGRNYVVSFPKNDQTVNQIQDLAIFVASSEPAKVVLYNDLRGIYIPKEIKEENGVITFSFSNGDFGSNVEIIDSERILDMGLMIESDVPISVYAINSRRFTTDGFMAIPVSAWGNEYIHCAYYDYNETAFGEKDWGSGFQIMASEDNTRVTIEIKGRPGTETKEGRKVGDVFTIVMDKGQVYQVRGVCTTVKTMDLTGSRVTANKPIGMISFHTRTILPQPRGTVGSRDHMVTWMAPVQAWGKEYSSVSLQREGGGGDMLRFVASEPNTFVECFWYDFRTKEPKGYVSYSLSNVGDWEEYNGLSLARGEGQSVYGSIYIRANKPIYVQQYVFSTGYDETPGNQWDPCMFPVIAVEQFTDKTIFQTPSNNSGDNEYLDNFIGLIMIGDADNPAKSNELLSSIMLDGKQLTAQYPNILGNNIPGTDLFWIHAAIDIGPHYIEADTRFGGYIFGYSTWDSYAWPAATAYQNLGVVDTLEPVIEEIIDCGFYEMRATEFRDEPVTPNCDTCKPQIDQGIITDPVVLVSENFGDPYRNMEKEEIEDWNGTPEDYDYNYIFEVIDPYMDAYVEYAIADATGLNIAFDTLFYDADSVIVNEPLNFGLVRVGEDSDEFIVEVTSASDGTITIESVEIIGDSEGLFRIESNLPGGFQLEPRSTATITLVYTPALEWLDVPEKENLGKVDLDSLRITTSCLVWDFPVYGQGGEPYINVTDWYGNNGRENVPQTMSSEGKELRITNWNTTLGRQATWPLEIYGIDLDNIVDENGTAATIDPFTPLDGIAIDADGNFNTPIIIPISEQRTEVDFVDIEFLTATSGLFARDIPFVTNAKEGMIDNVSRWQVSVSEPGPQIFGITWPSQRVLESNQDKGVDGQGNATGESIIQNNGDAEIYLMDIAIKDAGGDQYVSADGNFRIMNERFPDYNITNIGTTRITIWPASDENPNRVKEIRIPVEFTPQDVYAADNNLVPNGTIVATFQDVDGNEIVLEANLAGEAFLPQIQTEDREFVDPVLVGNYADNDETVTVSNVGSNAPLYIWSITQDPGRGQPGDFEFADPAAMPDQANPWVIPVGESRSFDVRFRPSTPAPLDIETYLLYEHDGVTGENGDPITNPAVRGEAQSRVWGHPRTTGLTVVGFDFGNIISCDTRDGDITITNGSSNDAFTVTSIEPADGSAWTDHPEFVFPNGLPIGEVIPATGNFTFPVQYVPANNPAVTNSQVVYIVRGDIGNDGESTAQNTLQGSTYQIEIALDLPNLPQDQSADPYLSPTERFYQPGESTYHLGVSIDNLANDWAGANVTEIEFDIRYHFSWLASVDKDGANFAMGGAMPNDWVIDGNALVENVDPNNDEFRLLHVKASGPTPLGQDGILIYPYLQNLYGDASTYAPEIVNVSFTGRNDCITPVPTPGEITFNFCTVNIQWLDLYVSGVEASARYNDITDNVEFEFGVGAEVPTKLQMFDSNGNLVATAFDEVLSKGRYQGSISTNNLGNGAYLVRFTSGGQNETFKVMVAR